jgi:virginiamycin A acetyltransferase
MRIKIIIQNFLRIGALPKGKISIGKHTYGTPIIQSVWKDNKITIGDYCSIGPEVIMIPGTGHILPKEYRNFRVTTYPLINLKKDSWKPEYDHPDKPNEGTITIGNDVWIGARVIINPGITVGDGAIIGSGTVVTKDVEPYSIFCGNPGRVISYRYSLEQIEQLLKIAWWKWDEKKVLDNIDYFYGDIEQFINKFKVRQVP